MTKISQYPSDTTPGSNDYVLGNSASGPTTVRFLIQNLIAAIFSNIPTATQIVQVSKNPYKFRAYRTAAYTMTGSAFTRFPYDTKSFDTGTNLDIVTNIGRFTAPAAGFYLFGNRVDVGIASTNRILTLLYKNGVSVSRGSDNTNSGSNPQASVGNDLLTLVATDYVETFYYSSPGGVATETGVDTDLFWGIMQSAL